MTQQDWIILALGVVFGSINTIGILYFLHKKYIRPYVINKVSIEYNVQISKLLQEQIDLTSKNTKIVVESMVLENQNKSIKVEAEKLVILLGKVNTDLIDEQTKTGLIATVYSILHEH